MRVRVPRALGSLAAEVLGRGGGLLDRLIEELGDVSRVVRFARGLLEFSVRPDDIFIVSYPRSGTTWLQYALHLLTGGEALAFDHISQVAPWFERSLAIGSLSARELEALPSPRLFKSHLPCGWLPRGGRALYVSRDGRDVAISYYHFYRSHLRFDGSFDAFFARFLRGDLQYGSWFKHTAGWQAHRDDPRVLLLRYEELRRATAATLEAIARFCELAVLPERIAEVAALCRFEVMKRHQEKFDFATEVLLERGYRRGAFLRRGQVGEGAAALTAGHQAAFARAAARRSRLPTVELDLPRFLH